MRWQAIGVGTSLFLLLAGEARAQSCQAIKDRLEAMARSMTTTTADYAVLAEMRRIEAQYQRCVGQGGAGGVPAMGNTNRHGGRPDYADGVPGNLKRGQALPGYSNMIFCGNNPSGATAVFCPPSKRCSIEDGFPRCRSRDAFVPKSGVVCDRPGQKGCARKTY